MAALSRHLTSSSDVSLSAKVDLRDFAAEDVYLFLTRDNVELRAKMLDFLKVAPSYCILRYSHYLIMVLRLAGDMLMLTTSSLELSKGCSRLQRRAFTAL